MGEHPQCEERRVMNPPVMRRGHALARIGSCAAAFASIGIATPARAATKVRFLTNWFAEAEIGGFYQARATGLYERAGLDVEITHGSPEINNVQLLAGGDTDLMLGSDIQTLTQVEHGVPLIAVASCFQFELYCVVAHPTVRTLAELRGHPILISSVARASWWPWLAERYGYTDDQAQPYSYTYTRFIADPAIAQEGYLTYDGYALRHAGVAAKLFLLADDGYPTYGSPIITTNAYLQANPDVVARFVRASMEGWKSYLRDPAPGNALIMTDNPNMTAGQIAYSLAKLRAARALDGGEAATRGIGCMTAARWKRTRDFMVRAGLLEESTNWRRAFTTEIVDRIRVTTG
jgi:NitT/TauT family transport system substrate-binding protein